MGLRFRGQPTIIIHYGITGAKNKYLSKDFRRLGQLDLKLGYRKTEIGNEDYIVDYSLHGVNVSHYAEGLWKSDPSSGNINTKAWQFGLGSENGYGYSFDKTTIIPYRSSNFVWTRLASDFSGVTSSDSSVLALYDETFRFGQIGGMGIQVQFFPLISFDVAFKRGIIFPRHLFWKHVGSVVVEEASRGLLNLFTRRVFESSPAAGPIIHFFLHSGITYAIYELRKEDMNWPFSTTSPITYDTFTFGVRFNF